MNSIEGSKVVRVRVMSRKEMKNEGWEIGYHGAPVAIELDNGMVLYPSSDEEGNGPGAFFGMEKSGEAFQVVASVGVNHG